MKSEQQVLQNLILDTVTLLCRNTVNFQSSLQIQGLIGITLDNDVFIVHFNEKFDELDQKEKMPSKSKSSCPDLGQEEYQPIDESPSITILAHEKSRETCLVKTWTKEEKAHSLGRQKQNTSSQSIANGNNSTSLVTCCEMVKEEVDDGPTLSDPWAEFQMKGGKAMSNIQETSSIALKRETGFVSSELSENVVLPSEMMAFGIHPQSQYLSDLSSSSYFDYNQPITMSEQSQGNVADWRINVSQSQRRGRTHILHEGYRYRKDRQNDDGSISWRCCRKDCRGRVRLHESSVLACTSHNHASDEFRNKMRKTRGSGRRQAETCLLKPCETAKQETSGVLAQTGTKFARQRTVTCGGNCQTVANTTQHGCKIQDDLQEELRGKQESTCLFGHYKGTS